MKKYFSKPINYSLDYKFELPINSDKRWEYLFNKDTQHKSLKLGVRKLEYVFVNHYGLVLNNLVLVKSSAPNTGFVNMTMINFILSIGN